MKPIKAWFTLLLWACSAIATAADPPAQVGRISHVQGTVSFAPADAANDWIAAPINWPVTSGDRLWADRDGRAEIRIGANAIRAGASTSVDVLRLDDMATHLRLAQGTLHIRLRELDPGDNFEIGTPSGAVLLTRPGSYRVSVDGAGNATTVAVRQGQADVLTGNAPIPVNDNQAVTFSAAGQEFNAANAPDEFDNWAYARDRQNENLVTPRYVAPAMTGYEELDHHGAWQSVAEYGNVWFPTAVAAGWAPYRYGRWAWVSPWGWTWIDNAPWGFAPYHYGRWVHIGGRWAWAPGARVARPVYAPALVAFIGGSNWSVSAAGGPAVGWVPLGWREPYIPWYRHSPTYVRNVNVTHVTNVTVINNYTNVANVRYVNRHVPSATTVVTHDTFVRARPVHDARINVPTRALADAQVTHAAPVANPGGRHSLAAAQPGSRPPAVITAREVLSTRVPAAAPHNAQDDRPRVRLLSTAPPTTAPGSARTTQETPQTAPAPQARERGERVDRGERQPPRPENRAMVEPRTPAVTVAPAVPGAAVAPVVPVAPGTALPNPPAPVTRERADRPDRPDRPARAERQPPHTDTRAMAEPQATPANPQPAAPIAIPAAPPPSARERGADHGQPRVPAAAPAPAAPAVSPAQIEAQRQQQQQRLQEQRQRDEQQRQARALQQQQLEQSRAQHHQMQQQRALAVQQQRDHQMQQAQQVEKQRQAQRQQHREERQAVSRPAPPPHVPPPQAAKPKPEAERAPFAR